jgi:hypothetical protein
MGNASLYGKEDTPNHNDLNMLKSSSSQLKSLDLSLRKKKKTWFNHVVRKHKSDYRDHLKTQKSSDELDI